MCACWELLSHYPVTASNNGTFWKFRNLRWGLEYHKGECATPRQASWAPNASSVILLSDGGASVWCTRTETFTADLCFDYVHPDLGCDGQPLLLACSPDGRSLAFLGPRVLAVQDVGSEGVLHSTRFPSEEAPVSLAWSVTGDKLWVSRGDTWRMMCFGDRKGMQSADCMAELLREVSRGGGCGPAQPLDVRKAKAGNMCVDGDLLYDMQAQCLLADCPGWEAFL